jgi:hypothetical protein
MVMPVEIYVSADGQYTFLIMRGGVTSGGMWPFGASLGLWVMTSGFSGVTLLAGTGSPVCRERESNREIPEIFAYVNNCLHNSTMAAGKSYYETYNIRKFGYWIGKDKKKAH